MVEDVLGDESIADSIQESRGKLVKMFQSCLEDSKHQQAIRSLCRVVSTLCLYSCQPQSLLLSHARLPFHSSFSDSSDWRVARQPFIRHLPSFFLAPTGAIVFPLSVFLFLFSYSHECSSLLPLFLFIPPSYAFPSRFTLLLGLDLRASLFGYTRWREACIQPGN